MTSHMYPVPQHALERGATDTKWFAGLAMQAIIHNQSSVPDTVAEREEIALWAWRMGQAMVDAEERLHVDQDVSNRDFRTPLP